MRFCHALIEDRSASGADVKSQTVPQPAMLLEGHQRFIVLPAKADVVTATILASVDRDLIRHVCSSVSVFFANTTYPKDWKKATERFEDYQ